jgi:GT2 family glycosyltransferase
MPAVAVGIVAYDSAPFLARCVGAVRAQTAPPAELVVWDNASRDGSAALARALGATVVVSPDNLGFAGAANELVRRTRAPFLLLLNPDAYLRPDYVARLLAALAADPRAGSATGKLVRPADGPGPPVLDSAGHVLYRNRWALNRGEGEPDRGQYDVAGEVFGVCAAAALYRRAMLEDVRVGDQYLAASFFAYLEDVDLDWRARLRGWRARYEPAAVAVHERGHRGKRRHRNPRVLRHSLKNRYLMMLRNDRPGDVLRDLPAIALMEVLRLADYALSQPGALRGYGDALRLLRPTLAERAEIQRRRTAPPAALRAWLQPYPYAGRLRALLGEARAWAGGTAAPRASG